MSSSAAEYGKYYQSFEPFFLTYLVYLLEIEFGGEERDGGIWTVTICQFVSEFQIFLMHCFGSEYQDNPDPDQRFSKPDPGSKYLEDKIGSDI